METPAYIASQRIVGGNLALDLLNTQNGPAGDLPEDDALHDYSDVVAWGVYVGLLTDDDARRLLRRSHRHPDVARAIHEQVLATRADLYEVIHAIASGGTPPPAALTRLRRSEAEALAHAELVRAGDAYTWRWADDDLARPLWLLVHAAVELLTEGPLERLKGCPRCRFHFLDLSKNRSRRWCAMEDCGTEDKMAKYVARRAAARARTSG